MWAFARLTGRLARNSWTFPRVRQTLLPMAALTPQLLMKRDSEVLPVNGNAATGDAPRETKSKPPPEGMKVMIRRLPPGITEAEVQEILGEDWKPGSGKVDWFSFGPGKVAREYELRFQLVSHCD